MSNKSQTGLGIVDKSVTLTGSVQQVLKEDDSRGALLLMNCSAHDILIYFPTLGNGNVAPSSINAGAAGVFTLAAAASAGKMGGSYEPDGGWVPTNELWCNGTGSDVLVCYTTGSPTNTNP